MIHFQIWYNLLEFFDKYLILNNHQNIRIKLIFQLIEMVVLYMDFFINISTYSKQSYKPFELAEISSEIAKHFNNVLLHIIIRKFKTLIL